VNIEHRTPNIEHRSEEKRKKRTNPVLQRLNPDLSVEAIEGAVEEMGILRKITGGASAESEFRRRWRGERSRGRFSVFLGFSPIGETGHFTETALYFHGIGCFTNA
jgi:hypothetical protein